VRSHKIAGAVLSFATGAAFLAAPEAYAADCRAITDAVARLACFDKTTSAPKSHDAKNKSQTAPTEEFNVAKAAVERKLKDPMSAQWSALFKVKTKEGEFVCGAVNSKNSYSGYAGAQGFIFDVRFSSATLMLSGASDPEYSGEDAARYCIYCLPDPRSEQSVAPYCPSLIKSYVR
jgi:hypothetical protein